jgi:iron complex outermembrane receptor protein
LSLATLSACALTGLQARAQEAQATLPPITATAIGASPAPSIAGFGNRPLVSLPMQAKVITRAQLEDTGARRLSDLIRLEASTTDAYNSLGYWDSLTIRGFVIDQRFNYRREGLPISAETTLPLENKERIEILKGTSGIQAGTSAPGGLVNFVVKRPGNVPVRSVTLHAGERGSVGAAVDIGDRAGVDLSLGYRLNVAHEDRNPDVDGYGRQQRSLFAFAGDWRLSGDTLLDAEMEWSRQVGASVPGYSLTGSTVPAVRHPANLNNQPWSQANEFDALTGTVRLDHRLASGWHWVTQAGSQRLKTDDRLAYPSGCGAEGNVDRYCSDGTYDLYDYRSENEHRRLHSAQTSLQGDVQTGRVKHDLRVGVLASRTHNSFQPQAYNGVGVGNIDGTAVRPANPATNDASTNRTEKSIEAFASDAIDWGHGWTTWLGLRQTHLDRDSVRTDGTRATSYTQDVTTPWLAGSYEWQPQQFVYASWGQGVESDIVPGKPTYTRAGQALPALKSRQWELGAKGSTDRTDWSLAYFDIDRPAVTDTSIEYFADGSFRHRGAEGSIAHRLGAWLLNASAMVLDAEREGAANGSLNGLRPVNVPKYTVRLQTQYSVSALPGLDLQAGLSHEGRRTVLPDESIDLPSWTRTDVAARYHHRGRASQLTWRFGIDNLFDRRAWKESPFQYGHVYLFPLEARTFRLSLRVDI